MCRSGDHHGETRDRSLEDEGDVDRAREENEVREVFASTSARATAVVVLPTSRMTVSPLDTRPAATWPIAAFSSADVSIDSSTERSEPIAGARMTAPPWTRWSVPD